LADPVTSLDQHPAKSRDWQEPELAGKIRLAKRPDSEATAPFDAAAHATTEPAGLELVRNVVEGRVELGADALHRANCRNGNKGGDQTIFDRGRALSVPQKFHELDHLWSPTWHVQNAKPSRVPILREMQRKLVGRGLQKFKMSLREH
jgi:hypothetical protein